MALPLYNVNMTLEEALQQFDYATSQLVLHPFNGETEDTKIRRAHVLEAATDANNVSSRWIGVLEREHKEKELNPDLATRYQRDIATCMKILSTTKEWYSRIEKRERDSNPESEEIERIKREKNIISSYIDLMRIRGGIIRSMVKEYKDY